jgi:Ca-activated chloride channel family protein
VSESWSISSTWERPAIALSQSSDNLLRVRLQPPARSTARGLRLAIAMDTSRSMVQGTRLPEARLACETAAAQMGEDDRFHLAAYASRLHELVKGIRGGERLQNEVKARLTPLVPRGLTRTELALSWLRGELGKDEQYTRVGILVTDGVPTDAQGYPLADRAGLEACVRSMRDAGCRLYCVGIGDADYFDPVLLDRLAQLGGGRFIYHQDAAELATALTTLVADCRRISSKFSALRIATHLPGARLRAVSRISQDYQQCELLTEKQLTIVNLGVLSEDQPTDLLLELQFAPSPFGTKEGERQALRVELLQEGQVLAGDNPPLRLSSSFSQTRELNSELRVDASRSRLNVLMRDLQQSSEPRQSSQILERIIEDAETVQRPEIAAEAREQLSDLRKTGKLTRHRATSLLSRAARDEQP